MEDGTGKGLRMARPLNLYNGALLVALTCGLTCGACNCEPNTLEPSMNTVDPLV